MVVVVLLLLKTTTTMRTVTWTARVLPWPITPTLSSALAVVARLLQLPLTLALSSMSMSLMMSVVLAGLALLVTLLTRTRRATLRQFGMDTKSQMPWAPLMRT